MRKAYKFLPLFLVGVSAKFRSYYILLKLGGIWSLILVLLSIFGVALILERLYYFYKLKLNSKKFLNKLRYIKEEEFDNLLNMSKELAAYIIKKAYLEAKERKKFENRIEEETSLIVNDLSNSLSLLAMVGNIAPLLGFLGTVVGMIDAFSNIAKANTVSTQLVAGGIYTALITTALGLIIAIPSISFYNYFLYKINKFVVEIEKSVNIIIERKLIDYL